MAEVIFELRTNARWKVGTLVVPGKSVEMIIPVSHKAKSTLNTGEVAIFTPYVRGAPGTEVHVSIKIGDTDRTPPRDLTIPADGSLSFPIQFIV